MSYHRILPPPPALTNQDRTGGWVPRRDSLLQNKIMAENSFKTIANKTRDKSLTSVQSNPSPTDNRDTSQPSDALVEEDIISSKARTRSSATLSNESSNPSDQPTTTRDSITEENTAWNTPSSICLCQPDPKVPRPRNGMHCHSLKPLLNQFTFPRSCIIRSLMHSLTMTIQHSSSTANIIKHMSSRRTLV
ncbi:MAG: hypothetical protein Q9201_001049 [Fulgogasparrea decipioides]